MKSLSLIVIVVLFLSLLIPGIFSDCTAFNEIDGLIIDPGETKRYSQQTLYIDGDLRVEGNLFLDNVTLILNANGDNDFRVLEGGNLVMDHCEIISYQKFVSSEITYDIPKGRNRLSFPLYREDDSLRSVLEPLDGYYDSVYYYDVYNKTWRTYIFGRPDHFNNLKSINRSIAVEVNFLESISMTTQGFLSENKVYHLKEGDNWISFPFSQPVRKNDFLSDVIDDVISVETVIGGNTHMVQGNGYMHPGMGYSIRMNSSAILTVEVENGISDGKVGEISYSGGLGLIYEDGSSGSIRNSMIHGHITKEGAPDIVLRSSTVSLLNSVFEDNHIGISIEDASPQISKNQFNGFFHAGIKMVDSSSVIIDNDFLSEEGWGIHIHGSSPIIQDNRFRCKNGIYTRSSSVTITENEFEDVEEYCVYAEGGKPLVDGNSFFNTKISSIRTTDSDISVYNNLFSNNNGAILITGGEVKLHENQFFDNGFDIELQRGKANSTISKNTFWGTDGWALNIEDSHGVIVHGNRIEKANHGMRVSGENIRVERNHIQKCNHLGILVTSSYNFLIEENIIRGNLGIGLEIKGSTGLVFSNSILENSGGASISAEIHFFNNTIANNRVFGMSVYDSSPYLENTIVSGNANIGMRFEDSNSIVKTSSIIGSRHHLYLLSSNIVSINTYFDRDNLWMDHESDIEIIHDFNISMKEDEIITGYDIRPLLPPTAVITGVTGHDNVTISMDDQGLLNIAPEKNYYGVVNFTIRLRVFDTRNTLFPVKLIIEPVNDPPVLEIVEFRIDYDPIRIRWVVSYLDVDDQPPMFVELVVNGDHYTMKEVDEEDTSYARGKLYYYEMYLEPGAHEFYVVAEETNPLGPNVRVRTSLRSFDVRPPDDQLTIFAMVFGGLSLLLLVIAILLLFSDSVHKSRKRTLNLESVECADSEEESIQVMIGRLERDLQDIDRKRLELKTLPVLKKKEAKKEELPVLKKKTPETSKKLRALSEDDPLEDIIDVVGDSAVHDVIDKKEKKSRRKRGLKSEEKLVIKQKHRVLKNDISKGAGRKHRSLKRAD